MDFARGLLEAQGWRQGSGLGKRQQGSAQHIKPAMKSERSGLGQAEPDYPWWEHVFNTAAKNIAVETPATEQGGGLVLKSKGQPQQISTQPPKPVVQAQFYGRFVKSGQDLGEAPVDAATRLSDEELFKACEGRTGHRAASLGHRYMANKSSRIAAAEQEFVAKYSPMLAAEGPGLPTEGGPAGIEAAADESILEAKSERGKRREAAAAPAAEDDSTEKKNKKKSKAAQDPADQSVADDARRQRKKTTTTTAEADEEGLNDNVQVEEEKKRSKKTKTKKAAAAEIEENGADDSPVKEEKRRKKAAEQHEHDADTKAPTATTKRRKDGKKNPAAAATIDDTTAQKAKRPAPSHDLHDDAADKKAVAPPAAKKKKQKKKQGTTANGETSAER